MREHEGDWYSPGREGGMDDGDQNEQGSWMIGGPW